MVPGTWVSGVMASPKRRITLPLASHESLGPAYQAPSEGTRPAPGGAHQEECGQNRRTNRKRGGSIYSA
eukprot:417700-Pyramimonas_sp.AAC.1